MSGEDRGWKMEDRGSRIENGRSRIENGGSRLQAEGPPRHDVAAIGPQSMIDDRQPPTPDDPRSAGSRSPIDLRIDSLILDGFEPHQQRSISEAIEHELTRLLASHPDPQSLASRAEAFDIDAGEFEVEPGGDGRGIGRAIARRIMGVLIGDQFTPTG